MARNKFGQFEKGTCGNPRGRPRKALRVISDEQRRKEFFDAAETQVSIVENGRRKMVSARVAIWKQLALKGAAGDLKAGIEFNKWDQRFTLEHVKENLATLEAICSGEERLRKYPEDVTDEMKLVLRLLRESLDPHFSLR